MPSDEWCCDRDAHLRSLVRFWDLENHWSPRMICFIPPWCFFVILSYLWRAFGEDRLLWHLGAWRKRYSSFGREILWQTYLHFAQLIVLEYVFRSVASKNQAKALFTFSLWVGGSYVLRIPAPFGAWNWFKSVRVSNGGVTPFRTQKHLSEPFVSRFASRISYSWISDLVFSSPFWAWRHVTPKRLVTSCAQWVSRSKSRPVVFHMKMTVPSHVFSPEAPVPAKNHKLACCAIPRRSLSTNGWTTPGSGSRTGNSSQRAFRTRSTFWSIAERWDDSYHKQLRSFSEQQTGHIVVTFYHRKLWHQNRVFLSLPECLQ